MTNWWTRERVKNGLRRYVRDFFENNTENLPLRAFSYRKALLPERRRAALFGQKFYPPYAAVLRHFASLFEAWRELGFNVNFRENKNIAANIAGKTFGWLTAESYAHSRPGSGRIWRLKCKCGREVFAPVKNLLRGRVVSCGCFRRTMLSKKAGEKLVKDLRGRKFGRLTPIRIVGRRGSESLWRCDCDCGGTRDIPVSSLTSRGVVSCGCLRNEKSRARLNEFWRRKNAEKPKEISEKQ